MADKDKPDLTPEQKKKLIAHLNAKMKGACPICLSQSWTIGPLIHALPWFEGNLVLGGGAIPMAVLVCTNCSFVAHFAAMPLGLVEEKKTRAEAAVADAPQTASVVQPPSSGAVQSERTDENVDETSTKGS